MRETRFDALTRMIASKPGSRRTFVRFALGGATALTATAAIAADSADAAACRKNGRECDPKKKQCCSGKCKRTKNGGGRCRPIKSAKGCTVKMNTCKPGPTKLCPGDPDGDCVVLDNGQPFCARAQRCFDCERDSDCTRLANGTPGKCITKCPGCEDTRSRGCFYTRIPD